MNPTLGDCLQGEKSLGPRVKWQFKLFFFFYSQTESKDLSLISEHSVRAKGRISVRNTKFAAPFLCKQHDHGWVPCLFYPSVLEIEPRSEKLVKETQINACI